MTGRCDPAGTAGGLLFVLLGCLLVALATIVWRYPGSRFVDAFIRKPADAARAPRLARFFAVRPQSREQQLRNLRVWVPVLGVLFIAGGCVATAAAVGCKHASPHAAGSRVPLVLSHAGR